MTGDPILDGPDTRYCGARKKQGEGTCTLPKGWGTSHPGHGRCKLHGGSSPGANTAAEREIAAVEARRFALPLNVDPSTALLDQVHALAGWVAWLEARVQHDGEDSVVTLGLNGEQASPYMTLLMDHRKQLAAVAAAAIRAGVEERRVKLAERQGDMLVGLIRAILDDLELTPGQRARVPDVVPRHLRSVTATAS